MKNSLSNFRSGIAYSAFGKYSTMVVQFIVQMVLARLLSPEEYGVVSVVNVFLTFFQMFADMGIGPAIIQNKKLTQDDNKSIYSFTIYLSVVIAFLFSLLAKPIANFYNNDEYLRIVPLMSVTLFFNSIIMTPLNLLQKNLEFKTVNMTKFASAIVQGLVSIILAYKGYSYYALIIGNAARAVVQFLIYYYKTRIGFSLRFKFSSIKKIMGFSSRQFAFDFINYFSRNLDSLLIGRYISPQALGYYDKAYQLSLKPNQILVGVVTPVIQPILSDYQRDLKVIKESYLSISKVMLFIGVPASVLLHLCCEDIIMFLFGDQWGESAGIFAILALTVWIQMLQSTTGAIFQSANRTDLLLLSGVLSTIVNVAGILIGVWVGSIKAVAGMIAVTFFINFFQTNFLIFKVMCKSSLLDFFKILIKPLTIGLVMYLAFLKFPDVSTNSFLNILAIAIPFLIVYLILAYLAGLVQEVLKLVKK